MNVNMRNALIGLTVLAIIGLIVYFSMSGRKSGSSSSGSKSGSSSSGSKSGSSSSGSKSGSSSSGSSE